MEEQHADNRNIPFARTLSRRSFVRNLALGTTAIGVAGLTGGLLSACSAAASETDGAGGTSASQGRTLRLTTEGTPASLDPNYVFDGTSGGIIKATTAALFRIGVDGIAQPDLADTYETSDDKLVYTITLKETSWISGSPVTAHDFVFSWKRLADPANAFGLSYLLSAAGIKNAAEILAGEKPVDDLAVVALDDKTLEITLERPIPYVERVLSNVSFYPIEQAFFEKHGSAWGTSPETYNANGPYKLSSYQPGSTITELVKNPDYYDADKVPFDKLTFQVITDTQQTLLAFLDDEIDIAFVAGDQINLYKDDPRLVQALSGQVYYLALNTIIPGLESPKLRQALGLAIDKDYLVTNILNDGSVAAAGFVPRNYAFDSKGTDFRDVAGIYQTVDKEKAARLWAEVKAEKGIDSFAYSVVTGDSDYDQRVAQYVQSEIQNTLPGITVELNVTPGGGLWYEELGKREWGFDLDWWWGEYPDAAAYLQILTSFSTINFSSYASEKFDEMLASADRLPLASDEKTRTEALVEAERIALEEDSIILPLFQTSRGYLVNPELEVEFAKGVGFYILETIHIR
jgi:oligopeptide transport system substrate-binding protein